MTHKRWFLIDHNPEIGDWENFQKWVISPGLGIRAGVILGRMDLSASFNIAGGDFNNYIGFGMGYIFMKRK